MIDNSQQVLSALEQAVERSLEKIGLTAEAYAKLECPVDTGRLRNSITHEVRTGEKAVYIGTNVEYAPYVELGTSKMAERPYLRPAVENHIQEYVDVFKSELQGI